MNPLGKRAQPVLKFAVMLMVLFVAWTLISTPVAPPPVESVTAANLETASLESLEAHLRSAPRRNSYHERKGEIDYEAVLCEVMRRGGPAACRQLTKLVERQDTQLQ